MGCDGKYTIDPFIWNKKVMTYFSMWNKEVFSEKSCFKNFAHPLSEKENIKK